MRLDLPAARTRPLLNIGLIVATLSSIVLMAWPGEHVTAQSVAQLNAPSNAQSSTQSNPRGGTREIDWDALVPKSWDPAKIFRELKLDQIRGDADPRAIEAMDKLRKAFDEAPAEPSLNGQRVKIQGFLVPLDLTPQAIGEFLLVPYFGACIHTPPPPANQIIHVIPKEPMKGMRAMESIVVEGTLEIASANTPMGSAGYRVRNPLVTIYKRP